MPKEKVEVVAYSGCRGEEVPRVFTWGNTKVEVAEIKSRWMEEGIGDRDTKRGFEVMGSDGALYRLIYHEQRHEWFCESKKNAAGGRS